MAIRRARGGVNGSMPAFLESGAWPGVKAWGVSVLGSLAVLVLLSAFAWHESDGRLPDVASLVISAPVVGIVLILFIAACWKVLASIPFKTGLVFLARILPLTWLVPLTELVRTLGRGIVFVGVPLDGPSYLQASLTGGIFPLESPLPIGIRTSIVAIVLGSAFVVWFTKQDVIRSVGTGVLVSLAAVKLLFLSSALAVWNGLIHGRGWVAGLADIQREANQAVINGYWWSNLYERFPTAVDGQSEIALRLTVTAMAVLALGVALLALFVWCVPARKRTLRHLFSAWSMLDVLIYGVGGVVLTACLMHLPPMVGTWWYALPIAFLMLIAFRIHATFERCLHRLESDRAAAFNQPVSCGDVTPEQAHAISFLAVVYALMAAWALGWPVFAALVVAFAASRLSRDRLWSAWPWAPTVFRAVGASSLALGGFFFASQQARLTGVAAIVMAIAAAHRVVMEVMKNGKSL